MQMCLAGGMGYCQLSTGTHRMATKTCKQTGDHVIKRVIPQFPGIISFLCLNKRRVENNARSIIACLAGGIVCAIGREGAD